VALSKIDCEEVLREIEHYVHGELDSARSVYLAEHLGECDYCLARADFRRRLKEIVRTKCRSEAPSHVLEKIRHTIRSEAGSDLP
jgi:anti-sigma factor (TIGR02949 family)